MNTKHAPLHAVLITASFLAASAVDAQTRVLVGHFAPFSSESAATAVDIRVNGTTALSGVRFGDFSDYLPLAPGSYTLEVVPAGTDTVAISATATLAADTDYTVLAVGGANGQPLALQLLEDDTAAPAAGNVKLRVVHAAPFAGDADATAVSIRTGRGAVVGGLSSVPFLAASGYLDLPAGTYDLKVASPDGRINLIDPAPVALAPGAVLTLVATGDGSNQPLGITALPLGPLPLRTPVDASISGHWYTPEYTGQGFAFTPKPDENRLLGSWYSFGSSGEAAWFTFDSAGERSGSEAAAGGGFDGRRAVLTVLQTSGGAFLAADPVTTRAVGTVTIEFDSCTDAVADIALDDQPPRSIPLTNLTPAGRCAL